MLWLCAATGLLALGAAFVDGLAFAGWLLLLALFCAALVDFQRLIAARSMTLQRTAPTRIGLSAEFARTLTLSAPKSRFLEVEVREEFPASFSVSSRTLQGAAQSAPAAFDPTGGPDTATIAADGSARLERSYRTARRGVEACLSRA